MATIDLQEMGARAKQAARSLARATTEHKNKALQDLADSLLRSKDEILAANSEDIASAKARNVQPYFVDRLTLNEGRLQTIADDVRSVAALPDPVGEQFEHTVLPNGLKLHKRRVPLGVLGVIYEARPNVTIDITALSIKSGNAAILRGGSETIHSNRALVGVIHEVLRANGLPVDCIAFIDSPDRAMINELLRLHDYVDLIIPRGGAALHKLCRENSNIPVITGGIGINHYYVDATVDQARAVEVIYNAKVQRPTVCNALGTLLLQRQVADEFLPKVIARLSQADVSYKCDESSYQIAQRAFVVPDGGRTWRIERAGEADFDIEWLSLILSVKVVDSIDEAMAHIAQHGTGHSDGILSQDPANIARFLNEVDSAAVYANASTRFTDGGQFGLGAEVAVSTQRVHARGPMGLRELTTYKWVAEGDGHIRPG
ncbi:MAG: glutamate-5-semialdehyde dehydrogenase [Chloroflexi bacterium]|nr:glutamate-5-semialdehyde dehydrogenase [Chloroflexota bacterium]MCL5274314.1 glutamate-5-semialdehyde dehydrogenase [Chloroflexota bacterium]